jgi:hypothetical protein
MWHSVLPHSKASRDGRACRAWWLFSNLKDGKLEVKDETNEPTTTVLSTRARLEQLAEQLESYAASIETDARLVAVPGSETGRCRIAVLSAKAEGYRNASAVIRSLINENALSTDGLV